MLSMQLPSMMSLRACAAAAQVRQREPAPGPAQHLLRAVELADSSAGLSAPHPNFGCVIAHGPRVVGEGFLYAQGTKCAELQAVERAREDAKGATAYLNLEPGDCHGDDSAITALRLAGVSRVVVGLRHPLLHMRGRAINSLRNEGVQVEVLGEDLTEGDRLQEALKSCRMVNAPLLCRAAQHIPFSILKYGMTLDGKVAASTFHAAWVTSTDSRKIVFGTRGRSDAIIVGGNTVRRDNPRLTTRQEEGHLPVRVVMSRTLQLPGELHLWDVASAPTIVMTQKGARRDFQTMLVARGVEVVEFDFLTPRAVMDYCYKRGFLTVMWECGGTLSAPAIASNVIHKVLAFVAPKFIGGVDAPTPVGELGMVEMSQALELSDVSFQQTGRDVLITGYLQPVPGLWPPSPPSAEYALVADARVPPSHSEPAVISFYKTWDPYGAFSNFSSHPISMPDAEGHNVMWRCVENYYQSQKFAGVQDSVAEEYYWRIRNAPSPEEAARFGRRLMRQHPDLVRPDWDAVKVESMYRALRVKFSSYPNLKQMLISTAGSVIVEASMNDFYWGVGASGRGQNMLGVLLMRLRSEFLSSTGEDLRDSIPTAAAGSNSSVHS